MGLTSWKTGKFKNYLYLAQKFLPLIFMCSIFNVFILLSHLGWYKGTVVRYDEKNDTVHVEFDTEKGIRYNYSISKDVVSNKIKLAKGMERLA